MTPEEYRKALEDLVVRWPVGMATLIQISGPLPDGDSDEHRAVIYRLVRGALEDSTVG